MAVIKESSIGAGLSGSIGEIYYRRQNNKTVVCSKPSHYTLPMDDDSIMRRHIMRHLMNFSKVVTKDAFFHPLWKKSQLKGVAGYHKCVGFNHPGKDAFAIEKLKLLPGSPEISVTIKEASYADRSFFITLNPLGNDCGINFKRETLISAGGFILLSNGSAEQSAEALTVPLYRNTLTIDPEAEMNFQLKSKVMDIDNFENFSNQTVFVLFSSLNSEEQPVKHSTTFVFKY